MPKVYFSGDSYTSAALVCHAPGEYDTTDEKAAQVVADFPHEFAYVEEPTKEEKKAK